MTIEEVYEVECSKQTYRRPGDTPLAELKRNRAAEAKKEQRSRLKAVLTSMLRKRKRGTMGAKPIGGGRRKRVAGGSQAGAEL